MPQGSGPWLPRELTNWRRERMSAFLCGDEHLRVLVLAGLQSAQHRMDGYFSWYSTEDGEPVAERLDFDSIDETARMLRMENLRSLNARYGDPVPEVTETLVDTGHLIRAGRLDPVAVLKAIACYEYQSCESSDWFFTRAAAYCRALRVAVIKQLPGYEGAPWEVMDAREVLADA